MNYKEAVKFFKEIPYFSSDASNDNLNKVLKLLGNPERTLKFFHVAGTNGKGSVCAFLDSILQKGGYKTALFTSPHLVRINERMKVNGIDISDEDFADYLGKIEAVEHPALNFFEYCFVMAMCYFADQKVDYVILECGLGGLLDSTNVIDPEVSIITSVGLDHTKILGDTLELIAAEKAGIIKPNKPVVYMKQQPEVNEVIETFALRNNSEIYRLSEEDIKIELITKKVIAFSIESVYYKFEDLAIATKTTYQLKNADVAIHAVKAVLPELSDEIIRDGIKSMRWPARMEEIEEHIILDGAHNPHAIESWVKTVQQFYPDCEKDLLFAVVADKDYEDMIRQICEALSFGHITITTIPGSRKANPFLIKEQFERYSPCEITIEENAACAYELAKAKKKDYLFLIGSLYLAGIIKGYLKEKEDSFHD
ncbi:MAG: bifunctional folylpolyglutamate synthase/dihydrofolate synthase [Lachnospiraceae bacterium]|nr:bifunctional folylpolyglutamate synthase/dihydrofolate synthase [Lachnospiraceae bacterium]